MSFDGVSTAADLCYQALETSSSYLGKLQNKCASQFPPNLCPCLAIWIPLLQAHFGLHKKLVCGQHRSSTWLFLILTKAWPGLAWPGLAWPGLRWDGMEWNGMEWNGMEWKTHLNKQESPPVDVGLFGFQ